MIKQAWKSLWAFWRIIDESHTVGRAAETAFFLLLSFFPLGMFASHMLARLNIESNNEVFTSIFPAEIFALIDGTAASPQETGGFVASLPLFAASVWAASAAIWALMRGVYHAYTGQRLTSVKMRMLAIAFTLGFVGVIAGTLTLLALGKWLALFCSLLVIFLLLLALYTLIPGLRARPRRAAAAAMAGAVGWLVLTRLFELYLRNINKYTLLYGGIGAFLGLALWLFCLCLLILIGAEWSAMKTRP